MADTKKLNLAENKLRLAAKIESAAYPPTGQGTPTDPIEGLVKALEAITDEMALQSELLAEIAYKQGAISEKRYKEIFE